MATIYANYSQNIDDLYNSLYLIFPSASGTVINSASLEGTSFTARTMSATSVWQGAAYGDGVVIAVASTSGTTASATFDGATWYSRTLPTTASWYAIAYGGGKFVAVSNGSTAAAVSTDGGKTFSASTMTTSSAWKNIAYGNDVFVALDNTSATNTLRTCVYNGTSWTTYTANITCPGTWSSITYGNNQFVAICSGSAVAATSPDGINWTARSLPMSGAWSSVCWGGSKFNSVNRYVAVINGSAAMAYSSNGIDWYTSALQTSAAWSSVCYGGFNGTFLAVNTTGTATSASIDGINWQQISTLTTITNGQFCMFAPLAWNTGDTLTIQNGTVVTCNTDQKKYWQAVNITDGKLLVQNSSTSTPISWATGKITSSAALNAITPASGLGSVEIDGSFIQIGTSNGTSNQTITSPYSNGDFIPALWVETGNGTNEYELWTNVTGLRSLDVFSYARNGLRSVGSGQGGTCFTQDINTSRTQYITLTGCSAVRGSNIITCTSTSGLLPGTWLTGRIHPGAVAPYGMVVQQIDSSTQFRVHAPQVTADVTNTTMIGVRPLCFQYSTTIRFGDGISGKIPPNGARIKVPNIIVTDYTSAALQSAISSTNTPCKFVGTNGGNFIFDTCLFGESYSDFSQSQSYSCNNVGYSFVPFVSECYQVTWNNVGCALPPVAQYTAPTAIGTAASGTLTSTSTTASWTTASTAVIPGTLLFLTTTNAAYLQGATVSTVSSTTGVTLSIAADASVSTATFNVLGPWTVRDVRVILAASVAAYSTLCCIGWQYVSGAVLNNVVITYGGYFYAGTLLTSIGLPYNGGLGLAYSDSVSINKLKVIRCGITARNRSLEAGVQLYSEGNNISISNSEFYNTQVLGASNVSNVSLSNITAHSGIYKEGVGSGQGNNTQGSRIFNDPTTGNALISGTKYWLKTRSYRTHDFSESGGYIDSFPQCAIVADIDENKHMPKFFGVTPNFVNLLAPTLAYGNGTWVTCCPSLDSLMYSTDNGSTWKTSFSGVSNIKPYKVIYANSKFIVLCGGAQAATAVILSSDGINWGISSGTAPASCWWQAIAYDAGITTNKLVAIGGTATAYSGALTSYSANTGTSWAAGSGQATATWVDVVGSGSGRFVAISGGGTAATASSYSTNGNTWTAGGALASSLWQSIAYGSSKFVAISSSAVNGPTAYSTDGTAWTASTCASLPTGFVWNKIIWTGSVFVALSGQTAQRATTAVGSVTLADFSQYFATSTDGITWSALKVLPQYTTWVSCACNGNAVGFISNYSGYFAYTTDITAATPSFTLTQTALAILNKIAIDRRDPSFSNTYLMTSVSITAGSNVVTCASTNGLNVGMYISCGTSNLPNAGNSVVTGITNSTTFTVKDNALRTASGLTFTASKQAHTLYRSTSANFSDRSANTMLFSGSSSSTYFDDTMWGITPGTTYYYVLRKYSGSTSLAGCSGSSGVSTVTTSNNFYQWRALNGIEGKIGTYQLISKYQNFFSLGIMPGSIVSGNGIPANTTVVSIEDYNQITLSNALTSNISPTGLAANKVYFSPAPGMYLQGGYVGIDAKVVSIDSSTSMTVSVANTNTFSSQIVYFVVGEELPEVACTSQVPTIIQNNLLQSTTLATTWTASSVTVTSAAASGPFDDVYGVATATTTASKLYATAANGTVTQTIQTGLGQAYTFSCWMRADLPENKSYIQVTLSLGTATNTVTLTNKWTRYSVSFTTTAATTDAKFTLPLLGTTCYVQQVMVTLGSSAPVGTSATTTVPNIMGGGSASFLQHSFRIINTAATAGWNIEGGSGIELQLDTAPTGSKFTHIFLGTDSSFTPSEQNLVYSSEATAQSEAMFSLTSGATNITVDTVVPAYNYAPQQAMLLNANGGASNITLKNITFADNGNQSYFMQLNPAYSVYLHNIDVLNPRNYVAIYQDAITTNNSAKGLKLQNIRSNRGRITWANQMLDSQFKGVFGDQTLKAYNATSWNLASTPTLDSLPTASTAVYDTMFHEMTFPNNKGCLHLNMVGSSKTSKPYTVTAGSPSFNNAGGLAMKNPGDQIIIEWPHWIKGVTGFDRRYPHIYSTDLGLDVTSSLGVLVEYDLDKGSGYSGNWKRINANVDNLANETGISPSTGFRIKLRLTARTGFKYTGALTTDAAQFVVGETIQNAASSPTATSIIVEDEDLGTTGTLILSDITGAWLTSNTIYNSSGVAKTGANAITATNGMPLFPQPTSKVQGIKIFTLTDTSYKYNASEATLTLIGLIPGSDIVLLEAGTTNIISDVDSWGSSSWSYNYANTPTVDIGILKSGYVPLYVRGYQLTTSNATLPIAQVADRNYI